MPEVQEALQRRWERQVGPAHARHHLGEQGGFIHPTRHA